MAGVPSSSRTYHDNVAKDQSRNHYGDVHGDAYYGDVFNNKRDIAQEILTSLRFPGMDRYHKRPLDSFPGTYEWIFDDISTNGISTNFKQWLTSSDEVYWVNGKAGSGKSCLMKLISEHTRTNDLLQEWAGGAVTIVPFFFWAAGGELERSHLGLMRSLLFQILDQYSDLVQTCLLSRWTAHERRANYEKPWSHGELVKALSIVTRDARMTSRFFFLIDGLDEFDGDHQDLIDYLDTLNASARVKLLVSSRPWNVFQAVYGRPDRVWRLRLQDLTSHDMDLFIKSRFETDPRFQALMVREQSSDYERFGGTDILCQLRQSAEGVFLWVDLVIKTLRRGLGEHDTLAGLSKRLMLLPKEIDAMLQHIFDSIEPVYQQLAARSFLILDSLNSHWLGLPVTWIAGLEYELQMKSSDNPRYDAYELEKDRQSRQVGEHLVRRCCRDLVEIRHEERTTEELRELRIPGQTLGRTYIRYGHRTMFDFIRSKVQGGYLQPMAGRSFYPKLSTCRLLVLVSASAFPEHYTEVVKQFILASKTVCRFKESEAELLTLSIKLVDIGATLEADGHSCCDGMQDELLRAAENKEKNFDLDDDLEIRVATLVGCITLVFGQDRLFWSLVAAKPRYDTQKSRRAWIICMLTNEDRGFELSGTLMKLCGSFNVADDQVPSLIDSSSATAPGPALHDLCEVFRCVRDEHQCRLDYIVTHVAMWHASHGAQLSEHLVDEELCEDILSWIQEENVNVQQLALSCPSPSYSVELEWDEDFPTELKYDEQEALRQFWPSLKQVMEHCQQVLEGTKASRSAAQLDIEAEEEKQNAESGTVSCTTMIPRKRRLSIQEEM